MNVKRVKYSDILWSIFIFLFIVLISYLHYTTPVEKINYHLIYMQSYFVPILIAAFQFGIRGGIGAAALISLIYFPHIMLQWGGLITDNLLRFTQIILFNVIGYVTGYKSQREKEETRRYQEAVEELQQSILTIKKQSEQLSFLEEQLRNSDRLAIIGELTASLAHEVRNPLGSIRGTVDILKDELPDEWKDSEFFQILVQETERLSAVVENYLSFARRHRRTRSEFDLREVIQNTIFMLNSSARKKGVNIQTHLPDDPVLLKGDPIQLQQILTNLVLNAIQAIDHEGHIHIICEFAKNHDLPSSISEHDRNKYKWIYLEIRDTGRGLSKEELDKIFDPFYTTRANGTGLGLAIVKRIVEENHWKINVDSEKGVGTKFVLWIRQEKEKNGR